MGFAFNKIAPIFKEMRKIDPKKGFAVVSGGSANCFGEQCNRSTR